MNVLRFDGHFLSVIKMLFVFSIFAITDVDELMVPLNIWLNRNDFERDAGVEYPIATSFIELQYI